MPVSDPPKSAFVKIGHNIVDGGHDIKRYGKKFQYVLCKAVFNSYTFKLKRLKLLERNDVFFTDDQRTDPISFVN